MSKLRIVAVESDWSSAVNVGGPVQVTRRTFDVECPGELAGWLTQYMAKVDLATAAGRPAPQLFRSIEGVEYIE